jgi:hypothetical protein
VRSTRVSLLKSFLLGAALPFILIGVCALLGLGYAVLNGFSGADILDAVSVGAFVGAMMALLGGADMIFGSAVGGLFDKNSPWTDNLATAFGYATIWVPAITWIRHAL